MTLFRPDIRAKVLLRIPNLGGKRVADEIRADGLAIIDATPFQRSEGSDGDFQGAIIYRPNVADSQRIREAGLVNGNALEQDGAAWADLTDLDYELYYLLHPYIVNECIRLAHNELWAEVTVPLTLWPDGDFSADDVLSWNNGAIAAPTKSTDSQYKFIGNSRTLVVPASGGNFYAQSEDVLVEPGDRIFHAGVGAVERDSSGTAYYALWDVTNDAEIYSTTFTSYRDQIIRRTDTIPDTCYKIALRLGATGNGCTTVWKAAPSHRLGTGTTEVQSWLKEQMNLLGFGPASYRISTGTDRFNATDRVWTEWTDQNGKDFLLMPFVPASNFYTLQINRANGLQAEDYWIHGYRRMSEIELPIDNETAGSDFDEDMLVTAAICLITEKLGEEYRELYTECRSKLAMQRVARPVIQPKRETGEVRLSMRSRW